LSDIGHSEGGIVKYMIEVISSRTAHEECLTRAIVDDTNPAIIRGKAIQLIRIWAEHGACRARILTKDGQTAMEIDVPG
jgi:hypothetical protein